MPQPNNPFPADTRLFDIGEALLARPDLPLTPKAPWKAEMTAAIDQATADENASAFVTAALHLLNDDLDRAHGLAQAHEGDPTADYLHMLVHRREGDWSNTGYWVRRAGNHPVYATLLTTLRDSTGSVGDTPLSGWSRWDPDAMVELCRQADQNKPDAETAAVVGRLSGRELAVALQWCVTNDASGAGSGR